MVLDSGRYPLEESLGVAIYRHEVAILARHGPYQMPIARPDFEPYAPQASLVDAWLTASIRPAPTK